MSADFERQMEGLAIARGKVELQVAEAKLRQATSEADAAEMVERYTAKRIANDRNPLADN